MQTDYFNLDSSSGFGINGEISHDVHTKCTFCGGTNHSEEKCSKRIRKEKGKARAFYASDNRQTEQPPQKCFRCGYEDHLVSKCPKPPKDTEKRRKEVRFNEKGNHACDDGKNNSNQKIYAYMAHMYSNDECPSETFGDSS